MKENTFFTVFIALPLLGLLILAGVVPVIMASPSKEEWTRHRMGYIADDIYRYRAERGNWPNSIREAWLSSKRPTKPSWEEYAFDKWGKPIRYHVENGSMASLRAEVPAIRSIPMHVIEHRLSIEDPDFSLCLPVTNVTLREVALSIRQNDEQNYGPRGHLKPDSTCCVYVVDAVPDKSLRLPTFWNVGRSTENTLADLSDAFGVPLWKTNRVAVFSPRIYGGKLDILSSRMDELGWLDDPIPAELSNRPRLDDFSRYQPIDSVSFLVADDIKCRNMIVPLTNIQLTWRQFFESLTKILPVDIIVDRDLVTMLPCAVDDTTDDSSLYAGLNIHPEF